MRVGGVSSFEVRALSRDAGESVTDEAVVVIGGADALAELGRSRWQAWIGRAPRHIVGPDSALRALDRPHDAFIARCDCGEEGCGVLIARITRVDAAVVWDEFRCGSGASSRQGPIDVPALLFDASAYDAALQSTARAGSWQPTSRRAAVIVNEVAIGLGLGGQRLRFAGCGHRGDDEVVVAAVVGRKGDRDYSFIRLSFVVGAQQSADSVAAEVVDALQGGRLLDDPGVDRMAL